MPHAHAIFSANVRDRTPTPIVRLFRHIVTALALCAVEAISGLSLFGSKRLLDHFGLAAIAQKWRSFFSLVFLCATALLILWVVDLFNRHVLDKWEDR
jgi:hypothetical protein